MDRFKHRAPAVDAPPELASQSRLRTDRAASESGEHSLRYGLVREVLLGYLSPVLVDSVLTRALKSRKLTALSLNEGELAELASDIMVGLRLFVPEARLATLMLELAEVLGGHQ